MASVREYLDSARSQIDESDDFCAGEEARARLERGDAEQFLALLEQRVTLIGRAVDDLIDAVQKMAEGWT